MGLLFAILSLFAAPADSLGARVLFLLRAADPGARLEVDTSVVSSFRAPEGCDTAEVSRLSQGKPGGTERFEVRWLSCDVLLGRRQFSVRVRRYEMVAAACSSLVRGHVLRQEDLCPVEVPALSTNANTVPVDSAIGLRLRRDVFGGKPLRRGELEALPKVLRDAVVRVYVAVGATVVETQGVVMQDAASGQLVRVRLANGRETRGRVEDDGSVRVIPGLH